MEGKQLFAFFLPDKNKIQIYKDSLLKTKKEEVKKIISSWDLNKYNPKVLREHAENFSKENFKKGLVGILEKHINENSR
jgi:glycogen synthase